jgi:hypothetical protein
MCKDSGGTNHVPYNEEHTPCPYSVGFDPNYQTFINGGDNINPDHYLRFKITPLQYIMANNIPWCEGNAIKYITRWKHKNGVEDLRKAIRYIELLIEKETGDGKGMEDTGRIV